MVSQRLVEVRSESSDLEFEDDGSMVPAEEAGAEAGAEARAEGIPSPNRLGPDEEADNPPSSPGSTWTSASPTSN